jgi:hypothetical protein
MLENLEVKLRMEDKTENTLRIDPETGAVVINDTMWIDPEWTANELEESEAYKKYVLRKRENNFMCLVHNVGGREALIVASFWDEKMQIIDIELGHEGPADTWKMQKADFIVLREILYKSFSGYASAHESDVYISYDFPWGSVVLTYDNRGSAANIYMSFMRS